MFNEPYIKYIFLLNIVKINILAYYFKFEKLKNSEYFVYGI